MKFILLAVLALCGMTAGVDAASMSATFGGKNTDGITGVVRFVEDPAGGPVNVEVSFVGANLATKAGVYHVHQMWNNNVATPEMDGMGDMCSAEMTGGHFNPTGWATGDPDNEAGDLSGKFGSLAGKQSEGFVKPDVANLIPFADLAGKSVVVHDVGGNRWICASIVHDDETKVVVAQAMFGGANTDGVQGVIRFVQTNLTMSVEYALFGLNGEGGGLHVHELWTDAAAMDGTGTACGVDSTGGHWNPTEWADGLPGKEAGDISGKYKAAMETSLGATPMWSGTLKDSPARLDAASIVGRSVVLHKAADGTRWACAKIMAMDMEQTWSASATFTGAATNGVTGHVTITQKGMEPAMVTMSLMGLGQNAGGIHVHEMGTADVGGAGDAGCGATVTGGHWNPTGWVTGDPDNEAGDLSGKFEQLTGLDHIAKTWPDRAALMRLPFLVGRAIVIHDVDSARYACANLVWDSPTEVTTARVSFKQDGVMGEIKFVQKGWEPAQVSVTLGGLNQMGGGYHVHEMPLAGGKATSDTAAECAPEATGGHFNPTGWQLGDADNEAGDLSGKFGALTDKYMVQGMYPDAPAWLRVKHIIGRSVVVHKTEGGARWLCGTIATATDEPMVATAVFTAATADGVSGIVRFVQTAMDQPTTVQIRLRGLNKMGGSWHVHETPLTAPAMSGKDAACSADATGGHFNPTGWKTGDADNEAGDLSGKFTPFTDMYHHYMDHTDTAALLMVGDLVGKSIVIHNTAGDRWVCATIQGDVALSATAVFGGANTKGVQGTYTVSQMTSTMTPRVTANLIGLAMQATSAHVHMTMVANDMDGALEECSSAATGGHWNPSGWATGDPDNEAGDLSGKFGSLSDLNTTSWSMWDKPLALNVGDIIGRSVVIHDASQRWVCATLHMDDMDVTHRAVAKFEAAVGMDAGAPITGQVEFTQVGMQPAEVTWSFTGLANRADKWHVHMHPVPGDDNAKCSAADVGGHWNPTAVTPDDAPRMEWGDLSGKFGGLSGDDIASTTKTDMPDMMDVKALFGKSVLLHSTTGDRWICATITKDGMPIMVPGGPDPKENKDMVATAVFTAATADGVNGIIRFTQASMDQAAKVEVRLRGLNKMGGGWHVHETPLAAPAMSGKDAACSSDATGGHFNPTGWATGDADNEAGDLSGKFEAFSGMDYNYNDYEDKAAMLMINDIIGKSIVIHNAAGDRWVCATIQGDVALSATATFNGDATDGVRGTIQFSHKPGQKAWITTNVLGLAGEAGGWHVHENALANDGIDGTSCADADIGGHFNPTGVAMDDPNKKEAGDMGGKFGMWSGLSESLMHKMDEKDYLSVASVIGKSVLIHKAGGERWICATIRMDDPDASYTARVTFASVTDPAGGAAVDGSVIFTQVGMQPAEVTWSFTGLADRADKWHVHALPGVANDNLACGAAQTGGHWNPTAVTPGDAPRMEWGDLSGKFGSLSGDDIASTTMTDKLDKLSVKALFGKSIVIHSKAGDRWMCATVSVDGVPDFDVSGTTDGDGDGDGDGSSGSSTLASSTWTLMIGVAVVLVFGF